MKFLFLSLLFLTSQAFASDAWIKNFNSIPSIGESKNAYRAWAGWNWPKAEGGLDSQINDILSPHQKIEKITSGENKFQPLSDSQRKNKLWWFGYCDAIVEASANYPCEPSAVDFPTQDGKTIHFNREEIKGVLAEYYSNKSPGVTLGYGSRKKFITPGLFHMAIGNVVGIRHDFIGMIFGGESSQEIHNHKIIKYESSHSISNNNKNTLNVKTKVYYSPELSDSTGDRSTTGIVELLELNYTLNINDEGYIDESSGKWISEEHPKMLWQIPVYHPDQDKSVPIQVRELIRISTQKCIES